MKADPAAPRTCLTIALAAGEGTRMKSALPKVLHPVAGRPMLGHVLAACTKAGADALAVVVGPGREDVAAAARSIAPQIGVYVQTDRLGTAHATLAAREAVARGYDDLLIVFGDTPLLTPATLAALRGSLADGAAVAAMGFKAADPTGYGRLIIKGDELLAIREQKDATEAERSVRTCNAGIMAVDGRKALALMEAIGNDNAQREFYLTDIVETARAHGLRCVAVMASEEEAMGVNDRVQLAAAEAVMQRRLREAAMRGGATMIAPDTVFMSFDTKIGRDVVIEPGVVFGPGCAVEDGAVIHAYSHLEGAKVGAGANVGPFARLRPGADLRADAKVGNFVEVKAALIGEGAKVSHLSYIGDASVGAGANIGAGTITCNYDGFSKFRTTIGEGAFIGSNSSLVAPVNVGSGAYVGSGSVVTKDVAPDSLALARGQQVEKPGWASTFRAKQKPKAKS
ncbi:MAG: bifunctional UDP-N-acetylglucosamine diphosphorylase/glucosamine-1-phosphate N-acetyltransferase GlmU [Beijerinckiaceae bacterium]|nr:bifunctional UDP-N-acetylglucosamine diphosphorylase/glucosamine-1-phosphate N-acetyltransferase GlmU [Beijerinckiaceae bacterium]